MALEEGPRPGLALFEEMPQSEDDQEGLGCTLVEKRSREHRGHKEKGEEEIECQNIKVRLHEMNSNARWQPFRPSHNRSL